MRVRTRRSPARGFTLIELGVVMLIIGLLISFILVVGMEGNRQAQNKANQALVSKLEIALLDRMDALTSLRGEINRAHQYVAATPNPAGTPPFLESDTRAQVIAQVDLIKAEMPDVFFVQVGLPIASSATDVYPFNFAGRAYTLPATPAVVGPLAGVAPYILPMGNSMLWDPNNGSFGGADPTQNSSNWKPAGTGIYGASYVAAAGLLKNLGALPIDRLPSGNPPQPLYPTGYDGVDNNGNGLVDELEEGLIDPTTGSINPVVLESVNFALANHSHKTARAEMLYALLVEGRGPFGSMFTTSDFAPNEIGDTDGDGLPEFLDPYGEPIQFFRWPSHFASEFQRGAFAPQAFDGIDNNGNGAIDIYGNDWIESTSYPNRSIPRDANPLDPSGLLVGPSWWANNTGGAATPSQRAVFFQERYFGLVDPLAGRTIPANPPTNSLHWDRNRYYQRRAFLFKVLVLSGGPDREPGLPRLEDSLASWRVPGGLASPPLLPLSGGSTAEDVAANLIQIEGQAGPFSPRRTGPAAQVPNFGAPWAAETRAIFAAGLDDVSNHNVQSSGGALAQ